SRRTTGAACCRLSRNVVECLLPEREHLVKLIRANDDRADLHLPDSARQTGDYSCGSYGRIVHESGSALLHWKRFDRTSRSDPQKETYPGCWRSEEHTSELQSRG